jgi:hypothetical protein
MDGESPGIAPSRLQEIQAAKCYPDSESFPENPVRKRAESGPSLSATIIENVVKGD